MRESYETQIQNIIYDFILAHQKEQDGVNALVDFEELDFDALVTFLNKAGEIYTRRPMIEESIHKEIVIIWKARFLHTLLLLRERFENNVIHFLDGVEEEKDDIAIINSALERNYNLYFDDFVHTLVDYVAEKNKNNELEKIEKKIETQA